MNYLKRTFAFLLLVLLFGSSSSVLGSQAVPDSKILPDSLPVPKNVKNLLFYVQRDPDANTIVYQLNLDENGVLQEEEPVHIFWIRYREGGARKELNYIQRKFAYGLNTKMQAKDRYELKFVSYGKLTLTLQKDSKGNFHVYAPINKKPAILERVFVRIEGGTFWVPNVLYVELKGKDAATGKAVTERFKP